MLLRLLLHLVLHSVQSDRRRFRAEVQVSVSEVRVEFSPGNTIVSAPDMHDGDRDDGRSSARACQVSCSSEKAFGRC